MAQFASDKIDDVLMLRPRDNKTWAAPSYVWLSEIEVICHDCCIR